MSGGEQTGKDTTRGIWQRASDGIDQNPIVNRGWEGTGARAG